jgi:hypothetical protein
VAAFTGERPKVWLPTVSRGRAGVWAAERPAAAQRIRGIPKLHLELSGTAPRGTVVAYLYDLDALGTAGLITHAPSTWLGTADGDRSIDLALPATAFDLPPGTPSPWSSTPSTRSTTTRTRRTTRSPSAAARISMCR